MPSGETEYFPAAIFAAQWFIAFIGRDMANGVARRTIIEHGLKPEMYGVKVLYDFKSGCIAW